MSVTGLLSSSTLINLDCKDAWDVLNGGSVIRVDSPMSSDTLPEVIDDDGTFRQDIFFNITGTKYMAAALHAARAADPHAKLYANDFNIDGPGPKATAYHSLIKKWKREGVPIDGLGIQAHLTVGQLPPNIKENLESFTKLGVEVALTELDIRITLPSTPELLEQQRKDYESVISACNQVKGCIGMTVWDFTDKYSWIPRTFDGVGDACPWDDVSAVLLLACLLHLTCDTPHRTYNENPPSLVSSMD